MLSSRNRAAVPHQPLLIALLASTALIGAPVSFTPALAQSLPSGGTLAAGSASIGAESNGTLTIHQTSANAIVNWQSFNIGQGNAVTFVQPDAHSAILNRVTGATSTNIAGSLTANGQVYLINPNGIAITATGTVNSGAFVASTLGISDADFMAGQRSFTGNGASNAVSNAGTLTIERGGYLALIGGSVDNSGTISVPMGKVALGSGEQATLDLAGDGFLQVAIPTSGAGSDARVSNSGAISANGGMVQLSAAAARDLARQAVNMSGTVEARGVSGRNGDITLFGGEGKVVVTGTVNASNDQGQGGSVTVASREIELTSAGIDASGTTSGGTIHIGGERQGGGALPHAETLVVDAGTTINADATISGNGGDVVLWSDSLTRFAGTISARGGALSGNGGAAEVSGKARLAYTGFTDLSAANGAFGTLLLDPYNVTISSDASTSDFTATGDDSVINAGTLLTALSGANVTVSTGSGGAQAGNITVAAPLAWNAGTTLTLNAASNINIDSAITAASGGLTLTSGGTILAPAAISIGGVFNLTSGNWVQNSATLPNFYAGDFQLNGGTFLRTLGGDGTSGAPYRLADVYGLQGIATSATYRAAHWQLANDLDAAGTVNWNIGAGFAPIGDGSGGFSNKFAGTFDGQGHIISGLLINRPNTDYVGLFGYVEGSTIRNIGLVGGGVRGRDFVGELAGLNSGSITQAYTTGSVAGGSYVGGLAGMSLDSIIQAYATGTVIGYDYVGGLVGLNYGNISETYATGAVTGTPANVGGIIGRNGGWALNSFWDMNTTGRANGVGWGDVSGVIGLTTAAARQAASYTGWDFTNDWYQSADMRPIGRWEAAAAVNGITAVNNLHQLALIGTNLAGSYQLGADINAAATAGTDAAGIWGTAGWVPIGSSGPNNGFAGTFDGQGHIITGLVINRPNTDYVGLFGFISFGRNVISNIGLVGGSVRGSAKVGGLVGFLSGIATISNAYTTGSVTGTTSVGGLVGENQGNIMQAYATGSVTGTNMVGGLVGLNFGVTTQVYATGGVTGTYSAGGIMGDNAGAHIMQSFWNTQTSGQNIGVGRGSNSGATGRTTAQMADPFTFIDAGWDFTSVWAMSKTGGTPVLRSLATAPVYTHYVRLSGDTNTTYGDTIATSGIARDGVGAGNVTVGWGSAISATTNVGNYAYGASNVLALSYSTGVAGDYYVDYGTGALTIDKRALTVTASAATKAYGVDNPPLTYTFGGAGLVNGDALHGALATAAGKFSEQGDYTITQGSLLASSNYSMTFLAGLLTVEPASPGPGSLASGNVAPHGSAPFFPPFLPGSTSDTGGNGMLIADPRFGGIVVCLEDGGCATLPASSQL